MDRRFCAVLPKTHRSTCVYCGDGANCREHFEPWALTEMRFWVPACNNCNSILGCRMTNTMSERCEIIRQRLTSKHRQALRNNHAALQAGCRGRLLDHLKLYEASADRVRRRISWLSGMIAMCDFELRALRPGSVEAQILAVSIDRLMLQEARSEVLSSER